MAIRLRERIDLVRRLYQRDDRPWVLAFSGGKDSTAVLQLTWIALRDLPRSARFKPVDVAYVDTGMDHPAYASQLSSTFKLISAAAKKEQMPFNVRILRPELKHRYFVAVIGRGYAPPTHWFRWCTKDMRIRPMSIHIKSSLAQNGCAVILLGLRRDESAARATTLKRYSSRKRFEGRYGSLAGVTAFTPIEDFRTEDVWQFLMQNPCPWGEGNRQLAKLYTIASGGECASVSSGDGVGRTCGGSRFGCWTCTVVRKDRAGRALADEDDGMSHSWNSEIG